MFTQAQQRLPAGCVANTSDKLGHPLLYTSLRQPSHNHHKLIIININIVNDDVDVGQVSAGVGGVPQSAVSDKQL